MFEVLFYGHNGPPHSIYATNSFTYTIELNLRKMTEFDRDESFRKLRM